MSARYLIRIGPDGAVPDDIERLALVTGLAPVWSSSRVALLVNAACPWLDLGGSGVVAGTVFPRHGPAARLDRLAEGEVAAIAKDGADGLLRLVWGGYVALLETEDDIEVLRDPSGALPCWRGCTTEGSILVASNVELLLAAGARTGGIDWPALGRILHAAGLPLSETALAGITALLPGVARVMGRDGARDMVRWSPWSFVKAQPGRDSQAAALELRRIVMHSIASWASTTQRPLVSLSGGLDSSIVAACLTATAARPVGIIMFTDDPAGDERPFAQSLAGALSMPLIEHRYELDAIDLARPLGAHLPRPFGRVHTQAYEGAHRAAAAAADADAFITGNGGDNVFGYSQSAAALADRMLAEGPGAGSFATLRDICRQTGAGPLRVARAALRLAQQPAGYRWKPDPLFLHPDLLAVLEPGPGDHPWLEAPQDALPGKAAHIAGLVRVQLNVDPDRSRVLPVLNPLLSQPILETCLSLPSWQWREGGRDRAVARAAFAADLPPQILARRAKGTPDPFGAEIVQHLRAPILARMRGGRLADHGLIDLAAIQRALLPERQTTGLENVRLLELVNVEAWLEHWINRLGRWQRG
jgi:asparagine synthase (glutamine-hydrolysing)